jgi:hypothetical protein
MREPGHARHRAGTASPGAVSIRKINRRYGERRSHRHTGPKAPLDSPSRPPTVGVRRIISFIYARGVVLT